MVDSVINALEKESKEVFERVDVESGNYGISYVPMIVKGHHVASIIIEYADQNDADVIIMESRGWKDQNRYYGQCSSLYISSY